jgi:ribose 5-phosphate isomerase B
MKIGIACDHHGVLVKQNVTKKLTELGYNVIDYGTNSDEMVDYPIYAFKVGEAVSKKEIDFGILFCNSGIGMSIACNKVKGVRCAKVSNEWDAEMTRRDNDANVIALSTRLEFDEMINIILKFLQTEFLPLERYQRRIELINNYHND